MSKLRSDELVNMEGDGSPNFPQGATSIEPTANNQVATKSYVDSTISAGLGNVVSSTAPTNPVFGSFWTDTSVAPRVLKTWDGTAWVEFDGTTAGISGLIRPPVEVLTPLNGSGITEFTQYEPLSSTITAVGEAGTITKNTDEIQSVADASTGAVAFDGSDLLTVPSFTTAPQGTNDWTIEFYAYFDSWSGNRVVTWADDTSHPNYRIAVQVESGKYYIVDGANYGSSWYSSKNDLASYTSVVAPLNKWHHVAVQRASGVDTIYVDGQVQFTASGHTTSSSLVTGNWTIGGGQSGTNHLIGKLSNFRVLNGTAQYSSIFTPPTTPLTNITNTVLLCCQSGSSVTAATVAPGTITAGGDPTATTANVTGNKILSFPTNTNFSGLSVGDLVQYATLNPNDKSTNVTLSNGNLSLSHTESNRGVRATIGISSGKYYWEVTNTSDGSGNFTAGIANSAWGLSYVGAENGYGYASQSGFYPTASGAQSDNANTTGDVVGFAFDADAGTLETYVNGVIQNSAAGWGTIPSGTWYPALGSAAGGTQTINFGATPFVHTPPTGYSALGTQITAIDASAPSQQTVYATLNPLAKSLGVTLSNGNLDASVGGDPSKVLSTIGMTSGKYYAEFTVSSGSINPGLATSATNLGSGFLGNDGGSWCYGSNGKKYHNDPGASGATYGATYTTGDVIGVAFDADNGSLTFYKNGATQGAAYTGLTSGPYFIAAGGSYSSYSTNFGATAFAHTPPSGYVGLSELVTTYPSVTVDGGDWDASNQSQVWSSQATGGSLGSVDIAFNGEVPSLGSSPSGGNYSAPMTFEPTAFSTPGSVNSLVIYGARNVGSPRYIKVDGVIVPFTDNNTFQELTVNVTSFSSIVCEHNGTDGSVIAAIYVNGKLLVDPVEDSQVWSSYGSGSVGNPWTGLFDGSTSTIGGNPNTGLVSQITFDTPITATSVRIYGQRGPSGATTFTINGGTNAASAFTTSIGWVDVTAYLPGNGEFTGFENNRTGANDHIWINTYAVEVNGKLLIDAGIRDFGDRYLGSSISYEKSLTFTDTTELANMVTPLEMVDANGDVVTPVSDTIANVNNNVLTLQGNTNLEYFQPGDEVQTGVEIVSVDQNAPSITVDGGEWLGADGTNTVKKISRSLRFNSADSAYLSRTPSSAGNRKTWTWSGWVKRGSLGTRQNIFSGGSNATSTHHTYINFMANNTIELETYSSNAMQWKLATDAVFRDCSAWQHIVWTVDTSQSTASDRVKLYINGTQVTSFSSATYPTQNYEGGINAAAPHAIGKYSADFGPHPFDGYLADVHFIDGQALAPTDFGKFDNNNVWQPKEFSGTYGTNGFHLDFSDNSSNAALGTDTSGNGNDWTVNNLQVADGTVITGGTSDVIEVLIVNGVQVYSGFDVSKFAIPNQYLPITSFSIQAAGNNTYITQVTVDGARLTGTSYANGVSGQGYTFNGGAFDPNPNGSYASPGDAGVLSWTSGGGVPTIGSSGAVVRISGRGGPGTETDIPAADDDSLVDTPTNYGDDTGAGGEVRGNYATLNPLFYSASRTYSNGNLEVVTGTAEARLVTSTIACPAGIGKWYAEMTLSASGAYSTVGLYPVAAVNSNNNQFPGDSSTSYGYTAYNGRKYTNGSGTSYGSTWTSGDLIGIAFDADNGTLTFYKNGATQGQAFSGISSATSFVFCVSDYDTASAGTYIWNFGQRPFAYPAPSGYKTLCDTNLPSATIKDGSKHFDVVTYTGNGSTQTISGLGFSPDLVWIKSRSEADWHLLMDTVRGDTSALFSNSTQAQETTNGTSQLITDFTSDGFTVVQDDTNFSGTSHNQNGSSLAAWAWNAGDTTETIAAGDLTSSVYDQSQTWSNWSAETGSLYIDGLRVSAFNNDFTNIGPGSYIDTIQWNGSISWSDKIEIMVANQASPSQSGNKGAWFFEFTHAGGTLTIDSSNWTGHNSTDAEISAGTIPFFDFTSQLVSPLTRIRVHGGAGSQQAIGIGAIKTDGKLLVDSSVSVPNVPSINSVVRANPAAGFSIVSWTGTGVGGDTVAHGLNKEPGIVLIKNRTNSGDWAFFHTLVDGSYDYLYLNNTNAGGNSGWTAPTNNIFAASNASSSGTDVIAYCFAPVEGYSAIGSYTGNGSADGPFVYTGFRPRFFLVKRTDSTANWQIYDSERAESNVITTTLAADVTTAESGFTSGYDIDFLSNGFKPRSTGNVINNSGGNYIYIAFAENPVAQDAQTVTTGDTQVALDALVAAATEIVETDGTTMYLNSATGPWRTGLSIEGSQINAAPPGPSEVTFTTMNNGTTPVSMIDATLSTRTWTLESSTTSTGPWTSIDTYADFDATDSQDGATPWTTTRPTLQPNTYYRVKVAYNSTNADSVESVYSTFKTGDA